MANNTHKSSISQTPKKQNLAVSQMQVTNHSLSSSSYIIYPLNIIPKYIGELGGGRGEGFSKYREKL